MHPKQGTYHVLTIVFHMNATEEVVPGKDRVLNVHLDEIACDTRIKILIEKEEGIPNAEQRLAENAKHSTTQTGSNVSTLRQNG